MLKKSKNIDRGAAIFSIIFALLFFLIFGRFFVIQFTGKAEGEILAARAEERYEDGRTIEAHRGTIYDRKGEAIALDTSTYTLIAVLDENLTTSPRNPQHVIDPDETAEKLAPILEVEKSEIYEVLTKKGRDQVEFGTAGRNLTQTKKDEIEKLKLPGIGFIRDTKRFYPNGVFASDIIGYAEKKDVDGAQKTVGMLGLEKQLDKYLREEDGFIKFQEDNYGLILPNGETDIKPPKNGHDVYLTIDQKIQSFLEDSMTEAVKGYEPEQIMGVVADPKTGKILAMSQRPSFNPNIRDIKNFYNDIVAQPFEPGSTMKVFTIAAAIEAGVYNGEELFQSGTYEASGKTIRDHNKGRGWGMISFDEGVQRSSNVAMAILALEKLGPERYMQYLTDFGFTEKTGIDLPNEANSQIVYNKDIEKVTTSYGQGSAFTAIQMIQGATAIGNDGKMMQPYVVDKIVDSKGEIVEDRKPKEVGQPISEETAKKTLEILETVVSGEHGTGHVYQIDGYNVAGKTGTAQYVGPEGTYMTGRNNYLFSFIGFAPAEDPELIVFISVKSPQLENTETGSMPVSSIFDSVMKNSLQYLQIDPSDEKEEKPKPAEKKSGQEVSSYIGENAEQTKQALTAMELDPYVLGDGGLITAQLPKEGETLISDEKVILLTDGAVKMPDLTGWSRRDVLRLADLLNLKVKFDGTGYVSTQSKESGVTIKEGDTLTVELKSTEELNNILHESSVSQEENEEETGG